MSASNAMRWWGLTAVFAIVLASASPAADDRCPMEGRPGATARGLGPTDHHAIYYGFITPVRAGERAVVHGSFPHARYLSIVVYDQGLQAVDAILDADIAPSRGLNPFAPGADRSAGDFGEFEVTVVMDDPVPGDRPANTLYAGRAHNGKRNRLMMLAYRIYLPDRFLEGRPEADAGGVARPSFTLYDRNGSAHCPNRTITPMYMRRMIASSFWANRDKYLDPENYYGPPSDPPVWFNEYSREERRDNNVVGNEDTIYVTAPVSSEFGELLVLRWRPPRTSRDTYQGGPFATDDDLRYYSLSFAYRDKSDYSMVLTERTVADVEVPVLPDGTGQLVVGFGGMARPGSVPPEQWVGLRMEGGFIIMRNILVSAGYEGDPGRLPAGAITGDADHSTPGGVYCSAAEFERDPGVGLRRGEKRE